MNLDSERDVTVGDEYVPTITQAGMVLAGLVATAAGLVAAARKRHDTRRSDADAAMSYISPGRASLRERARTHNNDNEGVT